MDQLICRKSLLVLILSFLSFALATDSLAQVTGSVSVLELKKVCSTTVLPNMIFLETDQARPTFGGTAKASAPVTIEINGVKNETTASSTGTWEWTSTSNLASGDLDLKITSGTQAKLFRLKFLTSSPQASDLASGNLNETNSTPSASASPTSVFPTETPQSSPQTEEVVSEEPEIKNDSNPLQAYLPFILGGLGIGVILLLISRLLKPKEKPLLETPDSQNTESIAPAVMPTVTTVPEPTVPNTSSWAPSVPSIPEITQVPSPTPNIPSVSPEPLVPGTTVQPDQPSSVTPPNDQPK